MDISIEKLRKAIYHLHLAEHLLEVTYPLIKDPKMLLSVLSNIERSHENIFEAVLPSNLTKINTSFVQKLTSFEDILKPQMVLEDGMLRIIKTVHDLSEYHKDSSVVFSRNDSFIICDDNYDMKRIDPVRIGEFVFKTKKLTKSIFEMVEGK